jgi:hypothetical protein
MPAYPFNIFSIEDIQAFEPAMKIGLLATVNEQGLPHLTMITTLKAASENELVWGQFMEGSSKQYIRRNPKTGWLIMTLDKHLWRGKASFTRTEKSGPDFDLYNNQPLFRYNAYFGVHTVYYMDLVSHSGKAALPMSTVIFAAVKTLIGRTLALRRAEANVFNSWTQNFINKLDNLKFLSYVDEDGFPVIIPAIQAQAADRAHVVFSTSAFTQDLESIPSGAPLAVFCLALTMEDVLVRGAFQGIQRLAGVRCGSVKVDWVYNSMPPTPGQVYPELEVKPVRDF